MLRALLQVDVQLAGLGELAASRMLEEILRAPVAKALDPLNYDDFDKIVTQLGMKLMSVALPEQGKALKKALQQLDVDWPNLSAKAQEKVIMAAKWSIAGELDKVMPKLEQTFQTEVVPLAKKTKKSSIIEHKLNIQSSLSQLDERMVKFASESQGHYIRRASGVRSDAFANVARKIVADGLTNGFGRNDIGAELQRMFEGEKANFGRPRHYWNMVAGVFSTRARSNSQISAFREAGIGGFTWESILDEATSEVCRFLHGRRFSVAHAIDIFTQCEEAEDPEAITDLNPFMYVGTTPEGKRGLVIGRGENRKLAATIQQSGAGKKDATGEYGHAMSDQALAAAGITSPPAHGNCRSTIVPDEESLAVPVPEQIQPEAPKLSPQELALQRAQEIQTKAGEDSIELTEYGIPAKQIDSNWQTQTAMYNALKDADPDTDWFEPDVIAAKMPPTNASIKTGDIRYGYPSTFGVGVADAVKKKKLQVEVFLYKGKYLLKPGDSIDDAMAAKLLNKKKIGAKVHDVDAMLKKLAEKPKAPSLPPPPEPGKPVDASTILGTKLAGPGGSNDGGLYLGTDGKKRYVKFYTDPSQAHTETLANNIYRALGSDAPVSQAFMHEGKLAYASEIVEGGKTLGDAGVTKERAQKFMKGFVGDVLTGNWDAVGMTKDNVLIAGDKLMRIDNGGTFLMRAKAGRKNASVLNAITEWDKFFDSGVNPQYSDVARVAGIQGVDDFREEVAKQIKDVVALRDAQGGWLKYVDKIAGGLGSADKNAVVSMLNARTQLLEEKLAELTRPKPPPPKPGEARFIGKQYSTTKKVDKFDDLPRTKLFDEVYEKYHYDKMPSGEPVNEYRKRISGATRNITPQQMRGVKAFTGSDYRTIRSAEEQGRRNDHSKHIQEMYEHATPEPGTVYRGIRNLPKNVIDRYLSSEVFHLGDAGPATSSSSWKIDVSIDNFMGGPTDDSSYGAEKWKILFKLNQKTGVPVQHISSVGEGECEVLLKKDAHFRVTGFSRPEGRNRERILIIEGEEILPGEDVAAEPEGKKPRKPRKPKAP